MKQFLTLGWIIFYSIVILVILVSFKLQKKLTSNTNLIEGKISKGVWLYVIPLMVSQLFQQSYVLVDTIIVGKILGGNALAAMSISGTVFWFIGSLFIGIAMGVGVIIAQYFGAKEHDNLQKAIHTAFFLSLVTGIFLAFGGIFLSKPILMLLNTDTSILGLATIYLKVVFSTGVFLALYVISATILQSTGDTTTPFIASAISTMMNILLDLIFILHFDMGLLGVALATVISEFFGFAVCLIRLLTHDNAAIKLHPKKLALHKDIALKIFHLGVPSGLQQATQSLGFLLQASLINGFGAAAMAAYGAMNRLDALLLMPASTFSSTSSTFTGQNIGAGQIERVKQGIKYIAFCSIGFTLVLIVPAYLFRMQLFEIFINADESTIINIGALALALNLWGYPFVALTFLLNGAIRGAGHAKVPLIIGLIGLWGVRLPVAYLLSHYTSLGINGIWLSSPIHWLTTAILASLYFKFGKWRHSTVLTQ